MLRTARSRLRLTLAALGTAAALAAGFLTPATATAAPGPGARSARYVALGDSFTSGPSIPTQVNVTCGRSNANYPSLLKEWLGITRFTDASCGGAVTQDMWRSQPGRPGTTPQLDAIDSSTTLVTLGIGGNDIGFGEVIFRCSHAWPKPVPTDNPCQRYFTGSGTDALEERIEQTAPKVADILKGIHQRAPHARIAVVGYPAVIGDDIAGCRTSLRIADGDIPYLRGVIRHLNAMLRRQAVAHDALYVNTNATTADHDACRPFEDRYVEGLYTRPERPAIPVHPNADGERAMALAVVKTLILGS
ncbi:MULTISPECIES: SGNH/GDSL hydrolase family protein [Streptomyces]|uniref:SGNH/GDSL hydrolase family protein n=1 Tax=Streptomyces luteosporeus TaxID=173856 RepID=A0ABN3TK79_9ACTN